MFVTIILLHSACAQEKHFETTEEQAEYLLDLHAEYLQASTSDKRKIQQNFFDAFPNTFNEMQALFGYDMNSGTPSPLYSEGDKLIYFFSTLGAIERTEYYKKYVSINLDGIWEADNIQGGFYLTERFKFEPEVFCNQMAKFTDYELTSVFTFVFDGPHPSKNSIVYQTFYEGINSCDSRLGRLLSGAVDVLIENHDGHGH